MLASMADGLHKHPDTLPIPAGYRPDTPDITWIPPWVVVVVVPRRLLSLPRPTSPDRFSYRLGLRQDGRGATSEAGRAAQYRMLPLRPHKEHHGQCIARSLGCWRV